MEALHEAIRKAECAYCRKSPIFDMVQVGGKEYKPVCVDHARYFKKKSPMMWHFTSRINDIHDPLHSTFDKHREQ